MAEESRSEWPKFTQANPINLVKECLDSTVYGALATHDTEGSWSSTIYFAYDSELNIHFVSMRNTRHMKAIFSDNEVGFSVFMPPTKSKDALIGVELTGLAIPVSEEEIEKAYTQRMRKLTGEGTWMPKPNEVSRIQNEGAIFMRIKPRKVYYTNSTMFGGDRKPVPLDKW